MKPQASPPQSRHSSAQIRAICGSTTLRAHIALLLLCGSVTLLSQSNERVNNWLKAQDRNNDSQIARTEATGLMARFFDRNDQNQDGFLDRQELEQLARRQATNQNTNRRNYPSDEALRSQAPENVTLELNIAYREGNPAWRLDLAKPTTRTDARRPAIVFVHGGGWRGGDKRAANFIGPTLEYAAKGYVTLSVNYRLDRQILPCVEDVKCAVRWLRAHADKYHIDPKRIGAYGNSAGAHLVSLLALSPNEPKLNGDGPWQEHSSALQAVVASATPTLPRFGSGSDEIKKLVAPIAYVSSKAPPMLLIHDASDRTVPVKNADDFVNALKAAGAPDITYKRYTNNSGHGVFLKNATETKPLMETFFARTLKAPRSTQANTNPSTSTIDVAQPRYAIPPTHADQKYGPHPRQIYDVWLAPSKEPTPVLLSIHGGGFRGGRRSVRAQLLKQCLEHRISVAALTYRFSTDASQPASFGDVARAIQTIRSRAGEWNLDPKRFVSIGGSAGAGLSLWLAFRDDQADPGNPDPIARQSTRILGAYVSNGQCTYDPRIIRNMFPGTDTWKHPALELMYDLKMEKLDNQPQAKYELMDYISPITHLSADDPPVVLSYSRNFGVEVTSQAIGIHHPDFGLMLQKAMTQLNIECHVYAKGKSRDGQTGMTELEFLTKRFALE